MALQQGRYAAKVINGITNGSPQHFLISMEGVLSWERALLYCKAAKAAGKRFRGMAYLGARTASSFSCDIEPPFECLPAVGLDIFHRPERFRTHR